MKIIKKTEREDGYIVLDLEGSSLSQVAYPADKFKNFESLIKEIKRKKKDIVKRPPKKEISSELKLRLEERIFNDTRTDVIENAR